jgi:soluble lytic murein transglycosylase-like protein
MTAKSIVDIEIRDGQFREFYELFASYQEQLKDMPDDWKKVVDAIDDAGGGMDGFAKSSHSSKEFLMIAAIQADAITKAMRSATGVQDKFNGKAKDGAIQMGRMAKFSKEMHKDIAKLSGVLLKIGALGGSAMTIPAAVFGSVNALAGQNLQSRGLGLRIGQTQAFGANFEKFGLGASDLGNIANAQGDVSKWRALISAGLTPQQIQNEDAEQLTYDFARAASGKYREWQKAGMPAASMAQAYGFTDFLSLQQLRTGASYSDQEWMKAQQKEIVAAQKAEVDQNTADQASDVKAALKSDWAEVVNTFNDQLAKAAPELKTMGDAAAAAAISLLKVAGPEAKSLLNALENPGVEQPNEGRVVHGLRIFGNRLRSAAGLFQDKVAHLSGSGANPTGIGAMSNLPPGLLEAQSFVESRGNPRAVSPKGAKGLMQLMDATAKQYGVTDPFDPAQSLMAGGQYDAFLLKRYGGDIRKALAAYNWGMGHLDKDVATNGPNWKAHAPRETQQYIGKIIALMAQRQGVNISITNSTAARVAVSQNAAPH